MEHPELGSPLPPDPVGREDIMSYRPREKEADSDRREGSPLPPDSADREDVIDGERQDRTADGGSSAD